MSIIAGIYCRKPGLEVPEQWQEELQEQVSRAPADHSRLEVFRTPRVTLVKLDFGAFKESGSARHGRSACVVAGDPLVESAAAATCLSRSAGASWLLERLLRSDLTALARCRGNYCTAAYDGNTDRLFLALDPTGVRPLYVWTSDTHVVFASALRIIKALDCCCKPLDLGAVGEMACFGYPLADRTPFATVWSLCAGEVLVAGDGAIRREYYWDWARVRQVSSGDVVGELYAEFRRAVRLRLGGDTVTASFLSGGLDSRAIVAALRDEGAKVLGLNFAPPGTQDHYCAGLAGVALGVNMTHLEKRQAWEGDAYSTATLREWITSSVYRESGAEHPQLLWSGDGGSVGLGHVYLNEGLVKISRGSASPEELSEAYLRQQGLGLSTRLLKRDVAKEMQRRFRSGLAGELSLPVPKEYGRLFYLFLMRSDQRRHLFVHFENLDLGRLEFRLPFYDSRFLECVSSLPIDGFLGHQLYMRWLARFPQNLTDVPWQAYPGHVPCPATLPGDLAYQWGRPEKTKSELLNEIRDLLGQAPALRTYVSRPALWLLSVLIRLGRTGMEHHLAVAHVLRTLVEGRSHRDQLIDCRVGSGE